MYYSCLERFAINERIDVTKLPFCTADWNDVKKILILSQGNACMELGFSINEQMLETNMKEQPINSGSENTMWDYLSEVVFWEWT